LEEYNILITKCSLVRDSNSAMPVYQNPITSISSWLLLWM